MTRVAAFIVLLSAQLLTMSAFAAPTARRTAAPVDWSKSLAAALTANSEGQYPSLYDACKSADFRGLATALYKAKPHITRDKSEYETNAEFVLFKQTAETTVNSKSPLVICQPLTDNKWATFTYDADRQAFIGEFKNYGTITKFSKRIGTYTGVTAYGARAKVNKVYGAEYDFTLRFNRPATEAECRYRGISDCSNVTVALQPSGCPMSNSDTFRYEAPVSRADAPSIKASSFLVFIGKLRYPFVTWGYSPEFPSLDQPLEMKIDIFDVQFAPETAAVVAPTGLVWRCDFSPRDESVQD